MTISARKTAEDRFDAMQKKIDRALTAEEDLRRERAERTARLRAQRLAKEATEKSAPETKAPAKKTRPR